MGLGLGSGRYRGGGGQNLEKTARYDSAGALVRVAVMFPSSLYCRFVEANTGLSLYWSLFDMGKW